MRRGSHTAQQVLIKWNNLPRSLVTWEDYEALRQEFPRATAWGQAVFQQGRDVSNLNSEEQATATGDGPTTGRS
jgi:hypothetical protein